MLAFALSFDEVIVTTFTAGQPDHLADLDADRAGAPAPAAGHQRGAVFVIAVTFVPILLAYYLTRGTESVAGGGK